MTRKRKKEDVLTERGVNWYSYKCLERDKNFTSFLNLCIFLELKLCCYRDGDTVVVLLLDKDRY